MKRLIFYLLLVNWCRDLNDTQDKWMEFGTEPEEQFTFCNIFWLLQSMGASVALYKLSNFSGFMTWRRYLISSSKKVHFFSFNDMPASDNRPRTDGRGKMWCLIDLENIAISSKQKRANFQLTVDSIRSIACCQVLGMLFRPNSIRITLRSSWWDLKVVLAQSLSSNVIYE